MTTIDVQIRKGGGPLAPSPGITLTVPVPVDADAANVSVLADEAMAAAAGAYGRLFGQVEKPDEEAQREALVYLQEFVERMHEVFGWDQFRAEMDDAPYLRLEAIAREVERLLNAARELIDEVNGQAEEPEAEVAADIPKRRHRVRDSPQA